MAQNQAVAQRILEALESRASEEGLDIVSVEVAGPQGHPVVRVRIDTLGDGDIDMDDVCARTPWVSDVVEALDPFPGAYELEVSSPGLDRPLRRESDFSRFVGERAEVRVIVEAGERSKGTGPIMSVEDGRVTLEIDGSPWTFEISSLREAHLKPDYDKIFAAAKERGINLDDVEDSSDEEDDLPVLD